MKNKIIKSLAVAMITVFCFTGCTAITDDLLSIESSTVGLKINADFFDNQGEKVMSANGEKVSLKGTETYNSETETHEKQSAVIVGIDGGQIVSCGDTIIFYEEGVEPDFDFSVSEISTHSEGFGDNSAFNGIVNSVKNSFGKSVVIVIKSQLGKPIYAFSGDSVHWEIEKEIDKTTRITLDDKRIYIHRANFQIIDKSLLK